MFLPFLIILEATNENQKLIVEVRRQLMCLIVNQAVNYLVWSQKLGTE